MKIEPIIKMQSGGGMPPFTYYTPLGLQDTTSQAAAETPAPVQAASTKDDGVTDKDVLKMVSEIDGLPSDTNEIIKNLSWLYKQDNLFNKGKINSSSISTRYLQAIRQIKNANFNRKEYDSALETVKANGGLNEVAITTTGNIVVQDTEGDIKQVSTDDYLNNRDKYFALKNSDLLYLRAHSDAMANKNDIFNTVKNGIGISTINKLIQGAIGKLGTMSISKESYSYKKENQILQGMEYINNIVNEGADLSRMGLDGVYKTGLLNKNQYQSAKAAIQYIYDTLDPNAITLLEVKSGNTDNPKKGALDLITQLVSSQLDTTIETTQNYEEKLSNTMSGGSGSDGGNARNDLKQLDAIVNGQSTVQRDYTLNPNSNYRFSTIANWWAEPQSVKTGEGLGMNTLDAILKEAGYGSAVMQNSIYFGDNKVDPTSFSKLIYDNSEGVAQVWLPYVDTPNGGIAPNLSIVSVIEKVEDDLRRKGNVSDVERRQAYEAAGIGPFWDATKNPRAAYERGVLRPFLVMTGVASDDEQSGIVKEGSTVDKMSRDERKHWKDAAMKIINDPSKNGNKKGDYDFDSWWEWELFGNVSDMFRGTIYMPMSGDYVSSAAKTGNINLPKSTFDAGRILQEGQIANNRRPLVKTNF